MSKKSHSKMVKAYHTKTAKTVKSYQVKTMTNRITGKPKKWKCYDDQETDKALDTLETLYTVWRRSRGTDKISLETAKIMLETIEAIKARILHYSGIALYGGGKTVQPTVDDNDDQDPADFWKGFSRN